MTNSHFMFLFLFQLIKGLKEMVALLEANVKSNKYEILYDTFKPY